MARTKRRRNRRSAAVLPARGRRSRPCDVAVRRALSMQPRPARIPKDPPPIKGSFNLAGTVPYQVTVAANGNTTTISLFSSGLSHLNVNLNADGTKLASTACSWNALFKGFCSFFNLAKVDSEVEYELALHKVSYWGPLPSYQTTTSAMSALLPEIELSVDTATPYSRCTVRDVGTITSRPCCAITLPYRAWYSSTSDDCPLLVTPDPNGRGYSSTSLKEEMCVGYVHVSMTVRSVEQASTGILKGKAE